MGEVAARLADLVVITSDNPRSEDPLSIIDAIHSGTRSAAPLRATDVVIEVDRYQAVERALRAARAGDVVVLAGKGHETTQTTGVSSRPFDDRVVAAEILRALFGATA